MTYYLKMGLSVRCLRGEHFTPNMACLKVSIVDLWTQMGETHRVLDRQTASC